IFCAAEGARKERSKAATIAALQRKKKRKIQSGDDRRTPNQISMFSVGRWWRTVRHLRAGQIAWRLWSLAERRLPLTPSRWAWPGPAVPRVRTDFPDVPLLLRAGCSGTDVLAGLTGGVFRHLNQTRTLGREHTDWLLGPVSRDRLWAVTLHYHAWLYELARMAAGGEPEAGQAAEL